MDKVKEFFGLVKRQHFWFIAPVLLVVGVMGGVMASKKLSSEFEQNKSTVQGYISKMQTVSSQQPHPNDDYHSGMEQLIAQRRDNVRSAWEKKWERQRQELKWPDQLPRDFLRRVDGMRPIEKVDVNDRLSQIPSAERRIYGDFIKNVLPQLAERIDAKWAPARTGGFRGGLEGGGFTESRSRGGEGREGGGVAEETHLVDWDPANQGKLEERFDWGDVPPSTLEVLYAQEDLWVLSTLIDIIQRTNGDAMTKSQAAIKAIEFIQIGADVTPPSGTGFNVIKPSPLSGEDASGADADAEPAPGEPLDFGPDRIEPPAGEFAAEGPVDDSMELVKNRYYDEKYEPIADKDTLLSSVTVAKRIPVRIRLEMDQRRINQLLVQCANSPLTFEVRQLRLNPRGGNRRPGFGGERGSMEGGGLLGRNQNQVRTLDDYQSFDRIVELFGIVYIFNPVDEAVLGGETGGGADADAADETALVQPADRWLLARALRGR